MTTKAHALTTMSVTGFVSLDPAGGSLVAASGRGREVESARGQPLEGVDCCTWICQAKLDC